LIADTSNKSDNNDNRKPYGSVAIPTLTPVNVAKPVFEDEKSLFSDALMQQ
jgi:hypothetical protein